MRQLPSDPDGRSFPNADVYVNSGSAGRFEGLIWCIEIDQGVDRVVSWSEAEDGRLRRIIWTSDGAGLLEATQSTYH